MTMGTRSMSFSSMKPMPHLLHKGTIPLQVVPTVPRDSHHGGGQHHAGNSFFHILPGESRLIPQDIDPEGWRAVWLAGPSPGSGGKKAESRPPAPIRKYTDISRAVGHRRTRGEGLFMP